MTEYLGMSEVDQQRMIIDQQQREIDGLRARLERAEGLLRLLSGEIAPSARPHLKKKIDAYFRGN